MDRKKELKETYRQMKPDMGIFGIFQETNMTMHLETTPDLKSRLNRARFELEFLSHKNRNLQAAWKLASGQGFEFKTLEVLPYDAEGEREDYTEDLAVLKMLWEERMIDQGYSFF